MVLRHVTVAVLLMSSGTGFPKDVKASELQATKRDPIYTIHGKSHPELVPAAMAWEHAFRILWSAATYPESSPTDAGIHGLAQYSLHVSSDDVRVIVRVARDTLDMLEGLQKPLNDEHTTG